MITNTTPSSVVPRGVVELRSEFSPVSLLLSPAGLPAGIRRHEADGTVLGVDLISTIELITGGAEVQRPIGGLGYLDTTSLSGLCRTDAPVVTTVDTDRRTYAVECRADDWTIELRYHFLAAAPHVALDIAVQPPTTGPRELRNLVVRVQPAVTDATRWTLNAPGNRLRSNVPLADFRRPESISPAGGLKGSAGLVALSSTQPDCTLLLWPFNRQEIGDTVLEPIADGVVLRHQTDTAGIADPGGHVVFRSFYLDLLNQSWPQVRRAVPDCLTGLGVTGPNIRPTWVQTARIFEVQIGFSVFDLGRWQYSPYPDAQALLDDLDRIQQLGFDTIQVMPQHPFPSYNVWDYQDVTTSWGDEQVLTELVDSAHLRGMHVIFDILLHGVVDKTAVAKAADGVRNGPFADRLDEQSKPIWSDDQDSYHVAYSRHIIDFEPYWSGGAPVHHPLLAEHPEWFCRDSAGNLIGLYTHAFDNANPQWQQFFIDSCLALVKRLDIDGFRFDAPTYNYFANWSERTRTHASISMLGCLLLFDRLRTQLKNIKPEAMMYTEPSGVLLRQAMDVNYNYDEQWLITATLEPTADPHDQGVRHARDLAQWFFDRDATLPQSSSTAHHIDSHDTFWWPKPGHKWLRERYGFPATRAMLSLFNLLGGPYMMFVGGETGIEESVTGMNRIRVEHPGLVTGWTDLDSVALDHHPDNIHCVLRRAGSAVYLVLINFADEPVTLTASVDLSPPNGQRRTEVRDLLAGNVVPVSWTPSGPVLQTTLLPFQTLLVRLQ